MKKFLFVSLLVFLFSLPSTTIAKKAKATSPKSEVAPPPAALPPPGSGQIEVRGQSRNLDMTLLLNNRTEAIKFVEPRKDYKNEILSTVY